MNATYELLDPQGLSLERGEAKVSLDVVPEERRFALDLGGASPLRLELADVNAIVDEAPAIRLRTAEAELVLGRLGPGRDELLRSLREGWRDLLADRLLLDDGAGGERFPGSFERGPAAFTGEVRVYGTRIAFLPDEGPPFAVGLGELREVRHDPARYGVDLVLADGPVRVGKLGPRTEPFRRLAEERLTALRQRTGAALAALLPLPSLALRRVAALLGDGVPAHADALDAIAPGTFGKLLAAAAGTPKLREAFGHLAALASPGDAAIGLKETGARQDEAPPEEEEAPPADGDEEGWDEVPEEKEDDPLRGKALFVVFPVIDANALVVETGPRSGRATYVFRLAPAPELAALAPEARKSLARARAADLGKLLVALGFQREPLYKGEGALHQAGFGVALRRLPGLRDARARLVGRAVHGPGWKRSVDRLLAKARG